MITALSNIIHDSVNLWLLPINYHFSSYIVLTVSLDAVTSAVETFGTFAIFCLMLCIVSYCRNVWLNIFSKKEKSFKNINKLQVLTKSSYKSFKSYVVLVKKFFKDLIK